MVLHGLFFCLEEFVIKSLPRIASGAKAPIDIASLAARLKSCPFKTVAGGIQSGAKALIDIAALRHD